MSGATVSIINRDTGIQRGVTTNAAGIYSAPALPPGTYSVRVNMTGFKSDVRNSVELQVNQVARLDFSFQVGNVSGAIEVLASAPTLDTENSTIGAVIENKSIEELPLNGRNYLQLASLVQARRLMAPEIRSPRVVPPCVVSVPDYWGVFEYICCLALASVVLWLMVRLRILRWNHL